MYRRKFLLKTFFLILNTVFLAISAPLFAQNAGERNYNLFYYGVVTNVNDQNMLNITEDLFAAQLRGISFVTLNDNRDSPVKDSYSQIALDVNGSHFLGMIEGDFEGQNNVILFFTRIYRPRSDEKWSCTFFAKNLSSGLVVSKNREYDSYYKILTDAKLIIKTVVSEACGKTDSTESPAQKIPGAESEISSVGSDGLAGTWSGEENISKIILMRSGRGFIVFNNGATMNISISSGGGGSLRIIQRDKFNASYYPDIDRKIILDYAESASPIEWNLTLTSGGTLEGTKKTLAARGDGVEPVSLSVVWKKR